MSDDKTPAKALKPAKPADGEIEYEVRDLSDVTGGDWESIGGGKVRRPKPKPTEDKA